MLNPAPPPALRKGSAFPGASDTRFFQGRLCLPVFHGYDFQGQSVSLHHKRGDSEIGRDQVYQACGYVEDLLASNLLDGQPYFRAFVVGYRISPKIERILKIGENPVRGRVEATTYLQLVRTAEKRLFRLRERLTSRYAEVTGTALLERVLSEPQQLGLGRASN